MKDYYLFTDFETTGLKITSESLPIEIGILITDDEYNILDTVSMYINPFNGTKIDWQDGDEQNAYKIHKIALKTILKEGVDPITVTEMIARMLNPYRIEPTQHTRFIIMSDNGQFEFNCMKKLYELTNGLYTFPFHYAAWDVNILINSVQKVHKGRGSHRALQDAFRTYKTVIRALERNGFRKWK